MSTWYLWLGMALIYKNEIWLDWKNEPTYHFYYLEIYVSCAFYTQLVTGASIWSSIEK